MPGAGFNAMFTLVPIFIGVVFLLVIGSIVAGVIKNLARWSEDNAQPIRQELASLVAKRTEVSGTRERSTTGYFLTFELPGSERREFSVSGQEYGLQAEGDRGQLRYQGSRYLGFARGPSRPIVAPPAPLVACGYCGSRWPAGAAKCPGCGSLPRSSPAPTSLS